MYIIAEKSSSLKHSTQPVRSDLVQGSAKAAAISCDMRDSSYSGSTMKLLSP